MQAVAKRTFTLGRYHCVERIGGSAAFPGPYGELWRAKLYGMVGVERHLLVKRFHAHLLSEAGFGERLAAAMAEYEKLEVPGLLPLLEVGQRGAQSYLVYDFAALFDLHRLQPGRLPEDERAAVAAHIGGGIAAALGGAHDRGALHLLLSPASVVLDGKGRVQVADLLLCRVRPPAGKAGEDRELGPLSPYLAPEAGAGDPRSDVFSLGAVLFEVLTGVPPRPGAAPPSGTAGELAGRLQRIVQRALSPEPSARQQTLAELWAELAALGAPPAEETLKRLCRAAQRGERQDGLPSTASDRSVDPLPPPPSQRPKDAWPTPAPPAASTRGPDVLRDVPLMITPAQIMARPGGGVSRAEPALRRFEVPESGKAPASARTPGAQILMSQRSPLARVLPAPLRAPALDLQREASPVVAVEEDEFTIPVPHSPKSKILIIEAEPPSEPAAPVAGPGLHSAPVLEETPLPVSVPFGGPTDPGEAASGQSIPVSLDLSDVPEAAEPPLAPLPLPTVLDQNGAARRRPAGFTDFDEPTALADYSSDSALADLVGMTTSDRSGPTAPTPRTEPEPELWAEPAAQGRVPEPEPAPWAPPLAEADMEPEVWVETEPAPEPEAEPLEAHFAPLVTAPVPRAEPAPEPPAPLAAPAPPTPIEMALPLPAFEGRVVVPAPPPAVRAELPAELPAPPAAPVWPTAPRAALAAPPLSPRSVGKLVLLCFFGSVLVGIGGGVAYRLKYRHRARALPRPALLVPPAPAPASEGRVVVAETKPAAAPPAARPAPTPPEPSPPAPPPAPKPAAGPGELPLDSTPEAAVYLDGKLVGATPIKLQLAAGPHQLVLAAEKHLLWRKDVAAGAPLQVKLDQAALPPEVAGKTGLKVRCSKKSHLRVFVDGHDSGASCPTGRLLLAPGAHKIGLFNPATGVTVERDVVTKAGDKSARLYTKL